MSKEKSWSDNEMLTAIKNSTSIRQVLDKLNLVPAGGNYATIHNYIRKNNIDTSHFLGQGHNKGKSKNNGYSGNSPIPLTDILKEGTSVQSFKLKTRLIQEGLLVEQCESCKKIDWLGKKIPLELDHINGIKNDNRLNNLRLLCPNCHAFTSTYRGKNINAMS